MRNIMHVRLALLALGCIIFGVEARRGDCGCGCGAASARLVPGPRGPVGPVGPVGPTGPCCLTGSTGVGVSAYACFYSTSTVSYVSGGPRMISVPLNIVSVNVGHFTLNSDGSFKVPLTGAYKFNCSGQITYSSPAVGTAGGGFLALYNTALGGGTCILPTGSMSSAVIPGGAPAGSSIDIWSNTSNESIIALDSTQTYALGLGDYNGTNPAISLTANGFLSPLGLPSAVITLEYLGAAS